MGPVCPGPKCGRLHVIAFVCENCGYISVLYVGVLSRGHSHDTAEIT